MTYLPERFPKSRTEKTTSGKTPSGLGDSSRRDFLQTVGMGLPTLTAVLQHAAPYATEASIQTAQKLLTKATPVDLRPYFNCSAADFGLRERAKELPGGSAQDGLIRTPYGKQIIRGIPFQFGSGRLKEKTWVVLSTGKNLASTASVEIPVERKVGHICLVAFADWDQNETPPPETEDEVIEQAGEPLADVVLEFDDGTQQVIPIRRRFETDAPSTRWYGHVNFNCLPLTHEIGTTIADPPKGGNDAKILQRGHKASPGFTTPDGEAVAGIWVSALANPEPQKLLKSLQFRAAGEQPLILCALTLFEGNENPLRYHRRTLYRLTLPEITPVRRADLPDLAWPPYITGLEQTRWKLDVDLGVVVRSYVLGDFDAQEWLANTRKGLGERVDAANGVRYLYAEVAATPDATLTLSDTKTGKQYQFDLAKVVSGEELQAKPRGANIEILDRKKVWIHGKVKESDSARTTPVRISFRSKEGRYLPPYGHRAIVNDAWFEDFEADLKLMDTSFAYVDGTFQMELPVGEVYVEMTKGFEYEAVRQKIEIAPGQRELSLEIPRFVDLRKQGWVTADTHVHLLSPTSAILEGQAEGVNMIHVLAAQLGDTFCNVGDLYPRPLISSDKETVIWVGSENRGFLGHVSLLGGPGLIYPMATGGPEPGGIGDPVWRTIAEWSDECRAAGGLVISPHFPNPNSELPADIVLRKIEAVEIYPWTTGKEYTKYNLREWYRYLNCGYRLPVLGGTDKMGAYMPVGANRTYAYLGENELNFDNWARAVRAGNTFTTTGPLLFFRVDGRVPGSEITLGAGGGTVEIQAEAKCFVPIHRLDVVLNGKVVASREESFGTRELNLKEKIKVDGPAWLAARCFSHVEPTTMWAPKTSMDISAHTSPVYVGVRGQELFSPAVATYLMTLVDGLDTWVRNLATRPEPEQLAQALKVFEDARDHLHHRLHEHVGEKGVVKHSHAGGGKHHHH